MFYGRSVVLSVYPLISGQPLVDRTAEYLSMNPALGIVLLGAVLVTTFRWPAADSSRFLVLLFWGVFGFFSSILPGDTPKDLDPVSWIWVDVTMFAAVILAGALLAQATGRFQKAAWTLAGSALMYAVVQAVI
jgi:hypothetical protein